MLRAGVGLSVQTDTEKASIEAAGTALKRSGGTSADLALVFATLEHGPHYSLMLRKIKKLRVRPTSWVAVGEEC